MKEKDQTNTYGSQKSLFLSNGMGQAINLGIVGGGRACRFFI
jgi:hypothetical protein